MALIVRFVVIAIRLVVGMCTLCAVVLGHPGHYVLLTYMQGLERSTYVTRLHNLKLRLRCSLYVPLVWLRSHAMSAVASRVVCEHHLNLATKHVVTNPRRLNAKRFCLYRLICQI